MANSAIQSTYKNCKKHTDTIMYDIAEVLKKKKIKFTHDNWAEIIVSKKKKDDVKKLLKQLSNVSESEMKMMITVTEKNGNVYIRQKIK